MSEKKPVGRSTMPDGRLPELVRWTEDGERIVVRPAEPPGPDEVAADPGVVEVERPTRRFVDHIPGSRPTDKQIEDAKRRKLKPYLERDRAERRRIARLRMIRWALGEKYRETGALTDAEWEWLRDLDYELPEDPKPKELGPPEPHETVKVLGPDLANPYGWTEREAEVVRLREVEGLSWRKIAERLGTKHPTIIRTYQNARAKVVPTDTPVREGGEEREDTVTEQERQDLVLRLVFEHGLDGYAATAAVDDPKVYALFEPEYVAAA